MGSLSSSTEPTIDAEKLKFFKTKVNIEDYAKISAGDFQKISFVELASVLKNYYSHMSYIYSVGAGKTFIYLFSFSSVFFFASLISRC